MIAFISFGSNLGDRLANLSVAKRGLAATGHVALLAASPVYECEPVGCPPQTRSFYNAVVAIETELTPHLLLDALQQIEVALGRAPTRPKNVPRAIDLDLLICGDEAVQDARLTLPHPQMFVRRFVLQPLADLDPDFVPPTQTKSVRELLTAVGSGQTVVKLTDKW